MVFLSIIIPIYNDEKYLNECLDSCLEQDISMDDYEIICVDDGSTDRTPEILRDYSTRYPNIHVITKQHGTAYGFGRNIGFAAAAGDFVWFVDHDDIVAPNILGKLKMEAADPTDYDRIAFPCYIFFDQMTSEEKERMHARKLRPVIDDAQEKALWSGIIRSSFLKRYDIWPHSKRNDSAAQYWGIKDFNAWGGDNVCMEECFDCGMKTKQLVTWPFYHYRRNNSSETMKHTSQMIDKREQQRLQSCLLRAYLAVQLRDQYYAERQQYGHASSETTTALILKIRRSVWTLSTLSKARWKKGMDLLQSKDLFFRHKPDEYSFSFLDYLKQRSIRQKLRPSIYAYYFMYTVPGAKLYRFFVTFTRIRMEHPMLFSFFSKRNKRRTTNLNNNYSA